MLRRLMVYALLFVVVAWIVLSYLPAAGALLPAVGYPPGLGRPFQLLLVVGLGLLIALHLWLIVLMLRLFRRGDAREAAVVQFGLRRGRELWWTALPLAMTAGLALAAYGAWAVL